MIRWVALRLAQELAREALRDFLLHGHFSLQEQSRLEDLATTLREVGLADFGESRPIKALCLRRMRLLFS